MERLHILSKKAAVAAVDINVLLLLLKHTHLCFVFVVLYCLSCVDTCTGRTELQTADLLPDGLYPEERARAVLVAVCRQNCTTILQLRAPGTRVLMLEESNEVCFWDLSCDDVVCVLYVVAGIGQRPQALYPCAEYVGDHAAV